MSRAKTKSTYDTFYGKTKLTIGKCRRIKEKSIYFTLIYGVNEYNSLVGLRI